MNGTEEAEGAGVTPEQNQPRKWTLTVPADMGFLNLNQRMHWAPKAELTRKWRRTTLMCAQVAKLPTNLDRVHITAHIIKPTNRSYDVHNLLPTLKAAIDGLVDYGLIPDDTNEHLVGPDLRQGGKGDTAVVLEITELLAGLPAPDQIIGGKQ